MLATVSKKRRKRKEERVVAVYCLAYEYDEEEGGKNLKDFLLQRKKKRGEKLAEKGVKGAK